MKHSRSPQEPKDFHPSKSFIIEQTREKTPTTPAKKWSEIYQIDCYCQKNFKFFNKLGKIAS
tara:strand:+ start:262 stop:447 length:186 start_codon:yes stop_codon:yes gene_type:complete